MLWSMPLACMSISMLAPATHHAVEHRLPEVVAALRDAALAVNAECDARYRRTRANNAVRASRQYAAVILRRQSLDRVVGLGAVGPLVAVHPEPELEVQPVRGRLIGDVSQRLQIAIAFGIGLASTARTL